MAKQKKSSNEERTVKYPEVTVELCYDGNAVTKERMIELMGWTEEPEGEDWKECMLKDENGKKIRCTNNIRNREFDLKRAQQYSQDVLTKNWKKNGSSMSIDPYGVTLDMQHRGAGLILANQIWEGPQNEHWLSNWPTAPTMDTIIVFGIDGSPDTTRTMDNVKPRTLSDVLFADTDLFGTLPQELKREGKVTLAKYRSTLAKMVTAAVKILWTRTQADCNMFASAKTNSEMVDFILRHKKLIECVKHIYTESDGVPDFGAKIIGPGYASGLCYLMAASATDSVKYRESDPHTEKKCKWDNWDKAEEFWVGLCAAFNGADNEFKEVKAALVALYGASGDAKPTTVARTTVLLNAWNLWIAGQTIEDKLIKPKYTKDKNGNYIPKDLPLIGGIDLGEPEEQEEVETEETEPEESTEPTNEDPTPEQLEEAKAVEDAKRTALEEALERKRKRKEAMEAGEPVEPELNGEPKKPRPKRVATAAE